MIYLTGDVHAKISGYWEQKVSEELDAAKEYLEILKKYNLSSTLFLNGKCLEESSKIKKLLEYNVEIGGHTYNNFGNMNIIKSYVYRKLFGCVYGPAFFQKKDITKTKKAFEKLGLKMISWRTHAFGSNNKTFKILKTNNVKYVSDLLGSQKPFHSDGLIHIPINIPVDTETIEFGILKPENRNPFASCTKGRIKPEEWFEIIKKRIIENEKNNIDSIILIHPITMKFLDNFKLFEEIAKFLSRFKSAKFSEYSLFQH